MNTNADDIQHRATTTQLPENHTVDPLCGQASLIPSHSRVE